MITEEHGDFHLMVEGQVIKMKCVGSWNIELVSRMTKELQEVAVSISDKPWACVLDLLDWELGVSEMWEEIALINKWSCQNNQKFEVVITDNSLIKRLLEGSHSVFTGVDTAFFDNETNANQWLDSKGILS